MYISIQLETDQVSEKLRLFVSLRPRSAVLPLARSPQTLFCHVLIGYYCLTSVFPVFSPKHGCYVDTEVLCFHPP